MVASSLGFLAGRLCHGIGAAQGERKGETPQGRRCRGGNGTGRAQGADGLWCFLGSARNERTEEQRAMVKLAAGMGRLGTESAFEVLARAKALEAQGRSIINLGIGQPDFRTPDHIVDAAV